MISFFWVCSREASLLGHQKLSEPPVQIALRVCPRVDCVVAVGVDVNVKVHVGLREIVDEYQGVLEMHIILNHQKQTSKQTSKGEQTRTSLWETKPKEKSVTISCAVNQEVLSAIDFGIIVDGGLCVTLRILLGC